MLMYGLINNTNSTLGHRIAHFGLPRCIAKGYRVNRAWGFEKV